MAFNFLSYSPLDRNDGHPQGQQTPSIHAASFASTDGFELRSYTNDSAHRRLLSQPSTPYHHHDVPHFLDQPALDFAKSGTGLWKNQMLVDRSLRGMALLTSIMAIGMLIVVFVWIPDYSRNSNAQSTAVFADEESCKSASTKNLVRRPYCLGTSIC